MGAFITDSLAAVAAQSPDRLLFQAPDGNRRTAADLDRASERLAAAFGRAGLQPGARVGVWMEDCAECVETYLALARAALVGVPLGRLLTADEVNYILEDVGAEALVYSGALETSASQVLAASGERLVLVVGVGDDARSATHRYADVIDEAPAQPQPPVEVTAGGTMLIAYSSGTTGFPKGTVLTYGSVEAGTRLSLMGRRLRPWGVAVLPASLSFPAMITAELFSHLRTGSAVIMTGGWGEQVYEAIDQHQANYLFVPSPVMADFAARIERDPAVLTSLSTIAHGGSAARPDVVARIARATGDRFTELWGMIENSGAPLTAFTDADRRALLHDDGVGASVGTALPGCVIEAHGPDGTVLPRGPEHVGELSVRSPARFAGYWHNDGATDAALGDGYYRTGDIGWLDVHGRVYLLDRRQDVIISGGINVYPSEVERVIAELPEVKDVVVVGLEHQRWGRTPVAVVVADALTEQQVVDHCRAHLASYKKPTKVVFVDDLPRNASNKVLRRVVIEQLAHAVQLGRAQ